MNTAKPSHNRTRRMVARAKRFRPWRSKSVSHRLGHNRQTERANDLQTWFWHGWRHRRPGQTAAARVRRKARSQQREGRLLKGQYGYTNGRTRPPRRLRRRRNRARDRRAAASRRRNR